MMDRAKPKGSRDALKHGARSAETLALKREIQALARMARETMTAIWARTESGSEK